MCGPFALSLSKGPRSPFDAAQDERMRAASPFALSLSKGRLSGRPLVLEPHRPVWRRVARSP